jgi:hypothetical protein
MDEDWRVELDIDEQGGLHRLAEAARERAVAREARRRLGSVSADGDRIFVYVATQEQAEAAAGELRELASAQKLPARTTITHWHPVEERWEVPGVALDPEAERARRRAREDEETKAWGYAEWEVRVEFERHRDAGALAKRLKAEGLGVRRRGNHVLIGAADEDIANALAERLRGELPEGTKVVAEGSEAYAWAELHRYSWLGGFGQ